MSEAREPKYQIGDKVKLNVGGPDMAVKTIHTDHIENFKGEYRCQWFAGKKLDWGDFPEESLVPVESSESAVDQKAEI